MFGGLNLLGKMFVTALGAWSVGKLTSVKLRGNQAEVNAVVNALQSSKRFREELNRPGATIDSVMEKLRIKHLSAEEFEKVLGVKWPL